MKGLLLFHEGWTDILNCLALIDYYLTKYDNIQVLMRKDARDILDYYIASKNNVTPIYTDIHLLQSPHLFLQPSTDSLFHGNFDGHRPIGDKYKGAFARTREHFVYRFYVPYEIDYHIRYEYFNLERNNNLEQAVFNDFVLKYGDTFTVYHGTAERQITPRDNTWINLNGITSNVFTAIKILEQAKEIHVIDSVWATLCYLLDCKYSLFKDKNIYLYPFLADEDYRSGGCLKNMYIEKLEPKHPANWHIIK